MYTSFDSCHGTTIVMSYCTIVVTIVALEQHLYQTIVQFDKTIVLPRKFATGRIHDLFLLLPRSGYSIQGTENS